MSHDEYFYISHTDPIPAACLQQMRTTRTQQEVTETTFNDRTKKKSADSCWSIVGFQMGGSNIFVLTGVLIVS